MASNQSLYHIYRYENDADVRHDEQTKLGTFGLEKQVQRQFLPYQSLLLLFSFPQSLTHLESMPLPMVSIHHYQ